MLRLTKRKSRIAILLSILVLPVVLYACAGAGGGEEEPWRVNENRTSVSGMADLAWFSGGGTKADAQQTVIFVHGTPGSATAWKDYIHNVPPGFRFLSIDRPGFGNSEPGVVPELERQARALGALMKDQEQPVILVGHSLGGPIIAQAAINFPEQVSALVILAGSLDPALEKINPLQHVGKWWPISSLLPRTLYNANLEIFALEAELEKLGRSLHLIKIPVLIVHGTQDRLVPYENVAYMEQMLTNARVEVVTLEGQNHFLPWNSREAVEQAIKSAATRAKQPEAHRSLID